MPLTKRQKRRLSETSKMIASASNVVKDMGEIQLEYAKEIDSVVDSIRKALQPEQPQETEQPDVSASSVPIPHEPEAEEPPPPEEYHHPEVNLHTPESPSWAKKLWKSIARECHPDRLNTQEIDASEMAKKHQWFLESRRCFETRDWSQLLHIGVQLALWVDDIPHHQQNQMLGNMYQEKSKRIGDIQTSLAWKWGTNWDRNDIRIQIVTVVCQAKGVPVPTTEDIVRILVNLELE